MARCIKLSQAATVLRLSDDAAAAFDCCGCNRCFVPANDKCGTVAMCVTLGDGKPLTDHVVRHKPSHRQAHAHARTHARTHERAHFLALMRARTCVGMCSCAGVRVSGTGAGDQSREHYMRTDVALRIGPTSGCGLVSHLPELVSKSAQGLGMRLRAAQRPISTESARLPWVAWFLCST